MVLRDGVSTRATVRCPNCENQYTLDELVREHFSHWEVIEDPDPLLPSMSSADTFNRIVDVPDTNDDLELQLAPETLGSQQTTASEATMRPAGTAAKVDWSKFKPITHEDYQRMRRQATSPWWTFVQVVLGGIAAVPVSLLLIWHVVGTDIGDAGPTVGRYVPWLVPEKFRPAAEEPFPEISQLGRNDDGLQDLRDLPEFTEDRDISEADRLNEKTKESPLSKESPASAVESLGREKSDTSTAAALNTSATSDLLAAIDRVETSILEWDSGKEGDTEQRRKLAQSLYGSLTDLSARLHELAGDDPIRKTVRKRLDAVALVISGNTSVQAVIAAGAKARLSNSASAAGDLAIIVQVEKVEQTDPEVIVQVTPKSPGGKDIPPVHIAKEFESDIVQGKFLLLLGKDFRAPEQSATNSAPSDVEFRAVYAYAW